MEYPIVELDCPQAKTLEDYYSITSDLEFSFEALKEWHEKYRDSNSIVARSLFNSGIEAFIRCFSTGRRTRLSSKIFSELNDGEIFFQYIAHVRNCFIAHKVNDLEQCKAGIVLSTDKASVIGHSVLCVRAVDAYFNNDKILQFITCARKYVDKLYKESEEIFINHAKTLSVDTLRALKPAEIRTPDLESIMKSL